MLSVEPFLSAYDPSDLPGGSIDPLGFDRGYAALAELILPGLTNAAGRPRYWSVECAAVAMSDRAQGDVGAETPRARHQRCDGAVTRLERFWTLACTLASARNPELVTDGVRGIRDAERKAQKLTEKQAGDTDADFRLLARQAQYGLLGIYGNVAERLQLVDDDMHLKPLGEELASAFERETQPPRALTNAVAKGGSVKVAELTAWGERAHINGKFGRAEAGLLDEALCQNSTRKRMAALLRRFQSLMTGADAEPELGRLARIETAIADDEDHRDLFEALRAIRTYEDAYRHCLLGFQRLLWLVKEAGPRPLQLADAAGDKVIELCFTQLPGTSHALDDARGGTSTAFRASIERVGDPARFVGKLSTATSTSEFVTLVLERHRDVQASKRVGGQGKAPWLELLGSRVCPTLAIAQRIDRAPETTADVLPHGYRTHVVDALRPGEDN